jgi:DNA-binding NtrC family response regulator
VNLQRAILIVEDEDVIRTSLREYLHEEGFDVVACGTCQQALDLIRDRDFQVAICDVQLPDGDGVALLRRLLQFNPHLSGLVITAYATVENAVEAFQAGAFDFLVKPVIFDDLAHKLRRLFSHRDLVQENQALRRELASRDETEEIIGSSRAIQEVQDAIRKVAAANANVLLVGESGTGKELFARTVHKWGPRRHEPFLVANCAIQPAELLEQQLFGSVAPDRTEVSGLFQNVGRGTLLLDEVSLLPLSTQVRLLRAIEYGEIMRNGATGTWRHEARLIAATTKDLAAEVGAGRFDSALFYRLDGLKLRIPPLSARLDDIPELVEHFVSKHSRAMGHRITGATSDTIRLLLTVNWRGNVRQLDNAIERAVMMCDGTQIQPKDLPPDLIGQADSLPDTDDLRSALRHYERLHIIRVLKQFPEKREAARRLRLGLSSLYRKIEELGIDL